MNNMQELNTIHTVILFGGRNKFKKENLSNKLHITMLLSSRKNSTYTFLKKIIPPTAKGIRQLRLDLPAHTLHSSLVAGLTVPCKVIWWSYSSFASKWRDGRGNSHSQESDHDTHPPGPFCPLLSLLCIIIIIIIIIIDF